MLEIERKILDINAREVEARIKKLRPQPKKVFSGLVRVSYFDYPDRRILKRKDLLRVREILPGTRRARAAPPFTEFVYKIYKGIHNNCKIFEELEIKEKGKEKFAQFSALLKKLGFIRTLCYEKKRTLYEWRPRKNELINFEIDEHPKIPAFLEIEAPGARRINFAIRILGLQKHEQTADSIAQLIKRKYPKIKLNRLKF